ncbi:MAG: hypothetical protein JNK23_05270 [Opitutaceae bacterium]|nr:hypothetical protein [Opitutaceae bacterium]
MTPAQEDFVHYVECIESLNRAWSILQDLGTVEKPSALQAAAFRFALIQYARPYTRSDGIHGRRKLTVPQLSPHLAAIHNQILDLRDQVLAHSDLTIMQAYLHLHSYAGKPYYTIASNLAEALPSRDAVIALIECTLDQMYVERDRRLQSLPTVA